MGCVTPPAHLSQAEAWQCWWIAADISTSYLFSGAYFLERTVHGWGRIGKGLQALAAFFVVLDIIGAPALHKLGERMKNYFSLRGARRNATAGLQIVVGLFVELAPGINWCFRLKHIQSSWRRVIGGFTTYFAGDLRKWRRIALLGTRTRRSVRVALCSRKGERAKQVWRQKFLRSAVLLETFEENYVFPILFAFCLFFTGWTFYLEFQRNFPQGVGDALEAALVTFVAAAMIAIVVVLVARLLWAFLLLILAVLAPMLDVLLLEPVAWVIGHPKNENLIKGISLGIFAVGFYFDLLAS